MADASEYVLEPIRDGAEFTLYRGRQRGNPLPVLVVAPTAEQPLPQSLRRLEHEYSLSAELDPTWAAKPLALTLHEGRTILVLADPGGEPLDLILERDREQPLDLARLLRLAISLATALGYVHERGLIHKDVKLENVLVDDAGHVWLTGFGIASRLPRERQAPSPPEVIAGTLAYMSPEQTGRMNRSIDLRSDLYSFGVTLYKMLTGVLPFAAADPLEWVHCHIARQPVAPAGRAAVPAVLSAITMRLLAKNAEERYQTAAGLGADLRRCLSEWQSHGRIDPFPLGADDSSDRFLIPEKLYGREREVDALLAAFDRVVAQGAAELVLVSGYSGVGKSSVVSELHKVLVQPRALFAAGKFDQYRRDVPYATLAQAFQMLVRQILIASKAEVDHWRHALLDALGPNGQLMVNLIPEVEFVIGKQPPVAELPPQEARGRFQLVFRRFLGAFATAEHPLALFLDDLQWLDTATLELLEHLVTDSDVGHVLLIGAYRDNEVSSSHPLMRTLAAIRNAGAKTQEIVLAPLGLDDVERLIAEALHCGPDSAGPLALLVHEKTGGNPFFAIQLLTALVEEGLLRLDRSAGAWIWDLDRIRGKRYSDNVVGLMLGKLRRLPHHTQTALQQLASIGNVAEIATMGVVFGQSEEAIHTALLEAVRTGLILRLERSYAFLHDRIQEAAYALIPESARAATHLRIGRVLLANWTVDLLAEHLFDVANQLNRGAELLIDHNEKVRVAAIDLKAGRKAKASAAYTSALAYFAAGMAMLDERHWRSQYELTFNLWLERAECELMCGNSEKAEQLIVELLPRAASKVDEAAVYYLKVQLHVMKAENQQAVDIGLTCLSGFGIDMPAHPTEEQVQSERHTLSQTLNGRPIESLIDLPLMTDPELQAAMKVLSVLLAAAQFTDFRLCCFEACRMVTLSVQYGTSGESATAYAYWGSLLGFVFHRYSDGYGFSKLACDVVEKHAFIANRGAVYGGAGVVAAWTQPIGTAIDFSRTGIRAAIETGSPVNACYGLSLSLTYLLLRGDPLDLVWRESEMALDFARKARVEDAADIIVGQQRFIASMQGRTATFSTFSDAQFDEPAFEARLAGGGNPMVACTYWIVKLKARLLSSDYTAALEAIDKAKQLLAASGGQIALLDYFYYAALTVSALYGRASDDEQQAWRELLMGHREQLREWAENYPPTFADKLALVSAEIARVEERDADALRLYEEAIHSAREHGFIQNEGLAHELAAQYCLACGLETAGYAHLRSARNCFYRWGALGKVKQLDERYPRLRDGRTLAVSATIGPPVGQLDIETVIKASQALSSEIVLPKLIEKLVRIAVENAGAERGLLILLRGGEPQIEAEATTAQGKVEVAVRQAGVTPSDLPQSALHYVIRTREEVLLDDASADNVYSKDEYVRRKRSKSVLCLPIVKQTQLVGALYLENNLTPCAFTPDRVTVLQWLASQAAISLENASLYCDLQRAEQNFRLIVDTVPGFLCTMTPRGQVEFVNQGILNYTGWTLEQLTDWRPLLHPDECEMVVTRWMHSIETGDPYDIEHRILGADGVYRWFVVRGLPVRDAEGRIVRWYILITDIDGRKKTEERLQRSEAFLAHGQRISHTGSFGRNVLSEKLYWSEETYNIYELDRSVEPTLEWLIQQVHPEDKVRVQQTIESAIHQRTGFDIEYRLLTRDHSVKYLHVVIQALENASGEPEFAGAVTDITAAKKAEEKIRQSEKEARQLLDLSPLHITELGPDGARLYTNRASLDYYGITLEEWQNAGLQQVLHPQDAALVSNDLPAKFQSGSPFEYEVRLKRKDGQYRWFHYRLSPMSDEEGRTTRWYAAGTDIDDRKLAEQRLQEENVTLREELDKASMFEEIVGTSAPLKKVLSRISKVAPTDSSVLITGETGTGKELLARAIHRRSRRSSRAFVSVNCAVIPRDLIASELFGHEKGAFTGATQRRLGRFELAEKGTLFLDEVGELPAETQTALLRVLQEHEFDRIGGSGPIRADVRVIAATNRDLESAIAANTFRSDLFYRLNVFPVEMPPLRERRADIPLLVTYFLNRYARKAGRQFTAVDKKSLDLLQAYNWPGNIRELQNVIERSVIVSESKTFSVDESWFSRQRSPLDPDIQPGLLNRPPGQEKAMIEAALRECGGRVYGPSGAAEKLGIPRTTLESKIRSLKINKNR
ncbi:MAG TPA: sigma 54-interacting transcriptional regulator, partial [Bryobacteraceae bacterium]|nr:sigma 54-interacting transcriptional regulator [Bryobacteraceae bacterium]